MRRGMRTAWVGCLLLCSCQAQPQAESVVTKSQAEIQMTSSAFVQGGQLPRKYTCQGSKISPPLDWGVVPAGTKSLAITCEDPDAPHGTFSHWVFFNLPANLRSVPDAVPNGANLPDGSQQGQNDFGGLGYGAPCPPSGVHHYIFKLYALDQSAALDSRATRQDLLNAMEKHILGQGRITTTYGAAK